MFIINQHFSLIVFISKAIPIQSLIKKNTILKDSLFARQILVNIDILVNGYYKNKLKLAPFFEANSKHEELQKKRGFSTG